MSGVSATAARSADSDRRNELGPSEGLPASSLANHGCRSRVARSACATAARSARQSRAGSGAGPRPAPRRPSGPPVRRGWRCSGRGWPSRTRGRPRPGASTPRRQALHVGDGQRGGHDWSTPAPARRRGSGRGLVHTDEGAGSVIGSAPSSLATGILPSGYTCSHDGNRRIQKCRCSWSEAAASGCSPRRCSCPPRRPRGARRTPVRCPSVHPRATGIGPRTVEVLRELGLDTAVDAVAVDLRGAAGKAVARTVVEMGAGDVATVPMPPPSAVANWTRRRSGCAVSAGQDRLDAVVAADLARADGSCAG